MNSRAIIDISQTLRPGIPVWPGEPDFAMQQLATIDENCPVNVTALSFSAHAGTHADSPYHYANDGASSAESDLNAYLGPCRVIDVRHASKNVAMDDIDWSAIQSEQRILFRTYDAAPADEWDSNFTAIDADVIDRLGANGVLLVGIDTPSLDPQESKTLDAHQMVLKHDMRILEGLVLDDVEAGSFELIALPLRIANGDASPVRAILRTLK